MALVDLANNAAGKIGGFGDQADGSGQVTAAELTADTTRVAKWVNDKWPVVRKKVIKDFAAMKSPFLETVKYADLGLDLKQYDINITSIVSSSTVVTITTEDAHGRSTGDTVYLTGIKQDSDEDIDDIEGALITSLNGTTVTIDTVPSTTTFTLTSDTAGVDLTWIHEANTGIVSYVPEVGPWQYAFNLPSDYFCLVKQTDESSADEAGVSTKYQCKPILNKDGDGWILLTNSLTNYDGDSAYIEYCIDQETFALYSQGFEEVLAVMLAYELCPLLGRDLETRQVMIAEYQQLTVSEAKRNIQSQYDVNAATPTNYLGGRSRAIEGL